MRSRFLFQVVLLLSFITPAFAQTQLISDGGFESPSIAPWVLTGGGAIVTGTNAYAGAQYLSMGNALGATESASQTITFPTNLIAATLSLEFEVLTSDTAGNDTLYFYLTDTNNVQLAYLGYTSNQYPGGWTPVTFNFATYSGGGALSSYAGKTVNVAFYVQTDPTYGNLTSFNIDNVSLVAATTANIPPNDNFTNATVILANTADNFATTTYASKEPGEPNHAGNAGGHSVWWTWTSATNGSLLLTTTGSAFNTLLAAYTGSSVTSLTNVISSDGATNQSGLGSFRFNVNQPGIIYHFALDGYGGQYGNAEFNFAFTPDTTLPTVAFTSPKAGADVTNATVVVQGTASDNVGVAAVYYRLENAAGTNAYAPVSGLTNAASTNAWSFGADAATWQATITNLMLGPNTIRVQAVDTSSNVSATVTRVVNYINTAPLGLATNGRGTISLSGAVSIASPTNGVLLDIGYKYVLTAKAAAGFAFTNWTGSLPTNKAALSFSMAPGLAFTANFVDVQKPVLTISAPLANQHWSNAAFTVTGKASDNVGVSNIWFQFNGSPWTTLSTTSTTNNWTNWFTPVALTSGANTTSTNVFKAFAEDAAGNHSPTNSVTFLYIESDRPQVSFTGSGAISPNYSNALLQLGRSLTMTATPGKTSVFSNWTDGAGVILTNGPALKFIMASNLNFTANFIPNPYYIAAGNYQGLFYNTNDMAQNSSGFLSATVNSNGTFTAKLQQGAASHPLSGQFSLTGGWFTNGLKAWSNTAVSLQLDLTGGNLLTGGLTNAAWSAQLWADRDVWTKNHPSPDAGSHTLVLPRTNTPGLPAGNGYGSATVSALGAVSFTGALGDGTKATQSAVISAQGQWPFYLTDGAVGGLALGWLTFTNEPDRDIDGWIWWFKPARSSAALYPQGFTTTLEAAGSAYSLPKGAQILDLTNGTVVLTGGDLTKNITNQFFLRPNNQAAGSNKLTLTFTTTSGLFTGSATNAAGKTVPFSGAVLQKQNSGFGQFSGANQTGSVSIEPN